MAVDSKISEQPKSLEETIRGAMNRAKSSFQDCTYSFGIESGLMQVPYSQTGSMDFCACAIYDGENHFLGLSCAFECPPAVMRLVHEEGLDLNNACYKAGLTNDPKIGNSEGIIGILTNGRVTRKEYTKQAIIMALMHLEYATLFSR